MSNRSIEANIESGIEIESVGMMADRIERNAHIPGMRVDVKQAFLSNQFLTTPSPEESH